MSNSFYMIWFFQKREFTLFEIYIKKWFHLIIWFLKTWILWTNQFQPNGSDSISYWIDLKLHALTYIESNWLFIKTRIWLDLSRRQTNDFLMFNFWHEKSKNIENVRWYHKLYMPLESPQWAKEHELHRKLNLKNV